MCRYWVCRLRDSLGYTPTASTIERNDATFIKIVKNIQNHSSKLFERRVKMAEQEAVKNAEEPDPILQSSNGGAGQHPPDRLNGSSIIHVEDEHHQTMDL